MRVLFPFLIVLILYSCSNTNKKAKVEKKVVYPQIENAKKLYIRKVGELLFRRSYADRQFREMSDAEIRKIERSNPSIYDFPDTTLLKKFHDLNLLDKKDCLIRSMFKTNTAKEFELTTNDSIVFKCQFTRPKDTAKYAKYNLITSYGNLSITTEIEGFYGYAFEDIKYLLLDIIPGGTKEIVILNEYYIMNGDNSDIFIYEINFK